MSLVRFEFTIPMSEGANTINTSDCSAKAIGSLYSYKYHVLRSLSAQRYFEQVGLV
jgi:hypothetical protein